MVSSLKKPDRYYELLIKKLCQKIVNYEKPDSKDIESDHSISF